MLTEKIWKEKKKIREKTAFKTKVKGKHYDEGMDVFGGGSEAECGAASSKWLLVSTGLRVYLRAAPCGDLWDPPTSFCFALAEVHPWPTPLCSAVMSEGSSDVPGKRLAVSPVTAYGVGWRVHNDCSPRICFPGQN